MIQTKSEDVPALVNLATIRRYFVPLGRSTLFRMISAGEFPVADIKQGGKIRLWRRETIENWVNDRPTTRKAQ